LLVRTLGELLARLLETLGLLLLLLDLAASLLGRLGAWLTVPLLLLAALLVVGRASTARRVAVFVLLAEGCVVAPVRVLLLGAAVRVALLELDALGAVAAFVAALPVLALTLPVPVLVLLVLLSAGRIALALLTRAGLACVPLLTFGR